MAFCSPRRRLAIPRGMIGLFGFGGGRHGAQARARLADLPIKVNLTTTTFGLLLLLLSRLAIWLGHLGTG